MLEKNAASNVQRQETRRRNAAAAAEPTSNISPAGQPGPQPYLAAVTMPRHGVELSQAPLQHSMSPGKLPSSLLLQPIPPIDMWMQCHTSKALLPCHHNRAFCNGLRVSTSCFSDNLSLRLACSVSGGQCPGTGFHTGPYSSAASSNKPQAALSAIS
jgi:hypothetical protein